MSDERRAGTGYVVAPDSGSGPGVLVLHSWWGLTPFFKGLCDRLADEGFVALAPDLHAGTITDTPDEAEEFMKTVEADTVAGLVLSSVQVLRRMPATPDGRIGVLGFSMGASWGLWASARLPADIAAAVAVYGATNVDFEDADAAYQLHFAEHDEFVSDDEANYLEASLKLAGRPTEAFRYPGTGHWFWEQDRAAAYVEAAAETSWYRAVQFLHAHLDDRPAGT